MNKLLFKHIDNSSLVVFRIFLGVLIAFESFGAILTGWVRRTLIEPQFTFNFIGFDWLQPLPGHGMYIYYAVMGILGLMIMVGYKYRLSMISFTLLWAGSYLMQKSSYNNHYYFLMVLSAVMSVMPAHRYASIDVKLNPELKRLSMPNWCRLFFFLQLFILYSFASVAKMYTDWIDLTVPEILMKSKQHYYLIGDLIQHKSVHYFIAYGGILFDGLVIPLLLWKPTRKLAFVASIIFHMFNSIVFQVGIFPYLSLAFAVFFFEPRTIQKLFLKKKPFYDENEIKIPKYSAVFAALYVLYFVVQVALPLRHHLIEDDVLWTEEGHRLSWRMMLRTRNANTAFTVLNSENNNVIPVELSDYLTPKQIRHVNSKPDFMWQFAQHLKAEYAKQGIGIKVYVRSYVSINAKPAKRFIDPEVDIANEEWHHFKHHDWILPSNPEKNN